MTPGPAASPTLSPPPAAAALRRRRLVRRAACAFIALLLVACILDRTGIVHRLGLPRALGLRGYGGDDWARFEQKSYRVRRVIDGATVEVEPAEGGKGTTVRLLGIASSHGSSARARLAEMVEGRPVTVRLDLPQTRDRWDRLLAYLYLSDSEQLNLALIAAGHARADDDCRHAFRAAFEQAESTARRKHLGIWQNAASGRPDAAIGSTDSSN